MCGGWGTWGTWGIWGGAGGGGKWWEVRSEKLEVSGYPRISGRRFCIAGVAFEFGWVRTGNTECRLGKNHHAD